MVKEADSKSAVLCTHRFESCWCRQLFAHVDSSTCSCLAPFGPVDRWGNGLLLWAGPLHDHCPPGSWILAFAESVTFILRSPLIDPRLIISSARIRCFRDGRVANKEIQIIAISRDNIRVPECDTFNNEARNLRRGGFCELIKTTWAEHRILGYCH